MPDRRTRAAALVAAVVVVGLTACTATPASRSTAPVLPATAALPGVAPPPAGGRFDYQIGGASTPSASVRIVDRDRADPSARGVYSICYVNAFQTQPAESGFWAREHPDLLLRSADGRPVADPDWPGEHVLDISTAAKRVAIARIVDRWIDGCARAGYRAVEPDNLDTYTRWPGRLTESQALAYARLLTRHAHSLGLAVAQKNAPDLAGRGEAAGFDFAIAEECQVYAECDAYTSVYGRHVIEIEYTDTPRAAFDAACRARGSRISMELRDRDVLPPGRAGHRAEWC